MATEKKQRIWDITNVVTPQSQYKVPIGTGGDEASVIDIAGLVTFLNKNLALFKVLSASEYTKLVAQGQIDETLLYLTYEDEAAAATFDTATGTLTISDSTFNTETGVLTLGATATYNNETGKLVI